LRVRDLDLPAGQLEPIVHEAGAVHRLDRRADRLAMPIESSRQVEQAVGIRRRGTNLDGRSLTIKQMEVETLAAEIQTGVQHRNRPPLDSSQSTSRSPSPGRPFFMALLTIKAPYHQGSGGCHGLRTVADRRVLAVLAGGPFASGCHWLRPLCAIDAPSPSS
jgi:hypothetical protein